MCIIAKLKSFFLVLPFCLLLPISYFFHPTLKAISLCYILPHKKNYFFSLHIMVGLSSITSWRWGKNSVPCFSDITHKMQISGTFWLGKESLYLLASEDLPENLFGGSGTSLLRIVRLRNKTHYVCKSSLMCVLTLLLIMWEKETERCVGRAWPQAPSQQGLARTSCMSSCR